MWCFSKKKTYLFCTLEVHTQVQLQIIMSQVCIKHQVENTYHACLVRVFFYLFFIFRLLMQVVDVTTTVHLYFLTFRKNKVLEAQCLM